MLDSALQPGQAGNLQYLMSGPDAKPLMVVVVVAVIAIKKMIQVREGE